METNPLKMKPYLCSTFSKSLKSLQYKVYPQWSFKKAISNWTSMPGCTIACHIKLTLGAGLTTIKQRPVSYMF